MEKQRKRKTLFEELANELLLDLFLFIFVNPFKFS